MTADHRDDLVNILSLYRNEIMRYSVKSLALFGSAARNRLRKNSDVDFLVQFEQPTWANYIGLKFYLQDLLDREVDLVTPKGLKPAVRLSVEKDLLYVVS
jgi:predicted nucleotidyltransferase